MFSSEHLPYPLATKELKSYAENATIIPRSIQRFPTWQHNAPPNWPFARTKATHCSRKKLNSKDNRMANFELSAHQPNDVFSCVTQRKLPAIPRTKRSKGTSKSTKLDKMKKIFAKDKKDRISGFKERSLMVVQSKKCICICMTWHHSFAIQLILFKLQSRLLWVSYWRCQVQ